MRLEVLISEGIEFIAKKKYVELFAYLKIYHFDLNGKYLFKASTANIAGVTALGNNEVERIF